MQRKTRTPGFIEGIVNASSISSLRNGDKNDKILPAGSWCCQVLGAGGRPINCFPIIRTIQPWAAARCSTAGLSSGGSGGRLIPCPQDEGRCCPEVGCNARSTTAGYNPNPFPYPSWWPGRVMP